MKITIDSIRRAISYGHDCDLHRFSDQELLSAVFTRDLNMGNIRVANVFIELQRIHGIFLPVEMFREMEDNTVGSFLKVANKYLNC